MWQQVTFTTIVGIVQGRIIKEIDYSDDDILPYGTSAKYGEIYTLDNGTRIAGFSARTGPYSSVTPDIDDEPPAWFLWKES